LVREGSPLVKLRRGETVETLYVVVTPFNGPSSPVQVHQGESSHRKGSDTASLPPLLRLQRRSGGGLCVEVSVPVSPSFRFSPV